MFNWSFVNHFPIRLSSAACSSNRDLPLLLVLLRPSGLPNLATCSTLLERRPLVEFRAAQYTPPTLPPTRIINARSKWQDDKKKVCASFYRPTQQAFYNIYNIRPVRCLSQPSPSRRGCRRLPTPTPVSLCPQPPLLITVCPIFTRRRRNIKFLSHHHHSPPSSPLHPALSPTTSRLL